MEVLAGHPQGVRRVNIAKGDNEGEVFVEVTPKIRQAYRITNIEWSENGQRSVSKAAAGAIAGAAMGGKRKDTSTAFIDLTDVETGQAVELHVRCDQKEYTQIDRLRS